MPDDFADQMRKQAGSSILERFLPFLVTKDKKMAIPFSLIIPMEAFVSGVFQKLKQTLPNWFENDAISKKMIQLTRALLVVNADCYYALNDRKKFILTFKPSSSSLFLQNLQNELLFVDFLFSKHRKSGESWAHRRWIWNKLFSTLTSSSSNSWLEKFVRSELKICASIAEKYPRNYYCWTQRKWIIYELFKLYEQQQNQQQQFEWFKKLLFEEEMNWVTDWNRRHLSDYSAFHYRQFLLADFQFSTKHQQTNATWNIQRELMFVNRLLLLYPGHESVWLQRRWLFTNFKTSTKISTDDFEKQIENVIDCAFNDGSEKFDDSLLFSLDFEKKFISKLTSKSLAQCDQEEEKQTTERFAKRYLEFIQKFIEN